MRLKNKPWAPQFINEHSDLFINSVEELEKYCDNKENIRIEIGCGKGQFIREHAKQNPDIHFIGLEKYESVIVMAAKPLVEQPLPNLKFITIDVQKLADSTKLNNKFSTIYLNFSDPWPKKRHYKRRLTYKSFLNLYEKMLTTDGVIIQKTDNKNLFAFSVESFSQNDWYLSNISVDLHGEGRENIKTEFEEKFSNRGFTINYLEARKDKNE